MDTSESKHIGNDASADIDKRGIKHSLIEGKEYTGIVLMPKFGSQLSQIECKEYPFPLQMRGVKADSLYPDAEVVFVAGKEPNQKDKSKFYWYAYNVRMKEE